MARSLVVSVAALVLASCGGGGGGSGGSDPLYVAVSYPTAAISLYSQTTIQPTFDGFNGHPVTCTLESGSPPPGMQLQSDCRVTGRPTQTGSFSFSTHVTASGTTGSVTGGTTVRVNGPQVTYDGHWGYSGPFGPLTQMDAVNDMPHVSGWSASPDLTPTWSYTISAGSLPTGLQLDPATGRISGRATATGHYAAQLKVVMTTPYGSYELPTANYEANVNAAKMKLVIDSGSVYSQEGDTLVLYVSQPFWLYPSAPSGATLSGFQLAGPPLPAGLALDPASGRVGGAPRVADTTVFGTTYGPYSATVSFPDLTFTDSLTVNMRVQIPVYVFYPDAQGITRSVGAPLSFAPVPHQTSPAPLSNLSYSYAAESGCSLPPGLSLNTATGVVSGTPTTKGTFGCWIRATITNGSYSWPSSAQVYITIQ